MVQVKQTVIVCICTTVLSLSIFSAMQRGTAPAAHAQREAEAGLKETSSPKTVVPVKTTTKKTKEEENKETSEAKPEKYKAPSCVEWLDLHEIASTKDAGFLTFGGRAQTLDLQIEEGLTGATSDGYVQEGVLVGQKVKKGDVLIKLTYPLDSLKAKQHALRAQRATALALQEKAAYNLALSARTKRSGVAATGELHDKAKFGPGQAAADAAAAKETIGVVEGATTPYEMRAELDGTVVESRVRIGKTYRALPWGKEDEPWLVLADLRMMHIAAWIPRNLAHKLDASKSTISVPSLFSAPLPVESIRLEEGREENGRMVVRVFFRNVNTKHQVWFGTECKVRLALK